MKATAKAPANIAFIKYWGKSDEEERIPLNDSFSMNLSSAHTITTVEFVPGMTEDNVSLLGGTFSDEETKRVVRGLDRIRVQIGSNMKAKVVTSNSFPKGTGSAASASGFAALTVAACAAIGASLSEKDLTILARLGSGSACRSIPDGFVYWEKGTDSGSSYAYSLYPETYWDLRDLLVIVDRSMKKISTTDGMEAVRTSPKLASRLEEVPRRIEAMKNAFAEKQFHRFGEILEEECLDMHAVMQSQVPPLRYWNETTRLLMDRVVHWRNEGIQVYFTIDAGPNVHLICEGHQEAAVLDKLRTIPGILEIISNTPAPGTVCISDHLF